MTQIFDDEGRARAATILRVTPVKITQIKSTEKDGYEAVKIASGEQKESRVSKAVKGHLKGAYRDVKEFRPRKTKKDSLEGVELGKDIDVSVFEPGDKVAVSSVSKGKGFQGVMKRHNFGGGQQTHGQSDRLRAPGSIGQGSSPSRVYKGIKMGGRMGTDRITLDSVEVVKVDAENDLLYLRGSIPGSKNSVIEISN